MKESTTNFNSIEMDTTWSHLIPSPSTSCLETNKSRINIRSFLIVLSIEYKGSFWLEVTWHHVGHPGRLLYKTKLDTRSEEEDEGDWVTDSLTSKESLIKCEILIVHVNSSIQVCPSGLSQQNSDWHDCE